MKNITVTICTILFFANLAFGQNIDNSKPSIFLVGDSTVNNSTDGFKGWGNVIDEFFNNQINVVNRARGGRSSRTYFTEGLWQKVVDELKSGDFVLIQFGHNDGGPIDKDKFRGSIRGIGEETQDITGMNGQPETIHTFGWYLRKFISDVRTKKATVILLSPVPRNQWKEGKVRRENESYGKWSREVAEMEKVLFVNLNEITALKYEKEKPEDVLAKYFTPKDNTHTSEAGARVNAESVVEGLKKLKGNPLNKYFAK